MSGLYIRYKGPFGGSGGGSGGVTSLNSLTGGLNIVGTGTVTVTSSGSSTIQINGSGDGAGTVTQVNSAGLITGGPITTSGTLTVSSIDLSSQVTGFLPNANLASISFTSISGSLPLSRTTGSISLVNQVNGLLPVANLASLSFTNISGTLPISQTSGSISLSRLSGATAVNTIANTNFRQTWNWDSLTSESAIVFASSSITDGTLLYINNSRNNADSTGNSLFVDNAGASNAGIGVLINHAGTDNASTGIKSNMTAASGNTTAIRAVNASADGGARGVSVSMSSATGGGFGLSLSCSGNGGSQGLNVSMLATTGANSILSGSNNTTASNARNLNVGFNSGSATGVNGYFDHGGTSGFNVQLNSQATGIRNQIAIDNNLAAANNTGNAIHFRANDADNMKAVAGVAGIISSITSGSYKGALILQTANNAAPAERVRVDHNGWVGIGTTGPGAILDVKGTIRLSGSTSGFVGLAPAAAAGSTTYTLPTTDGSSSATLTTNGSGVLSWAVPAGSTAPVLQKQVFTVSSSFVFPSTATANTVFKFTVVGGGGGGGGSAATAANPGGNGGGAGGTAIKWLTGSATGTVVVTVGAGGPGGGSATQGATGSVSIVTSGSFVLGAQINAAGGQGGFESGADQSSANGGTPTNGDINIIGGDGGLAANLGVLATPGGSGGGSSMGGGGFGGGSGASHGGGSGTAYGAGAGGATNVNGTPASGGNGKAGIVIVEWIL